MAQPLREPSNVFVATSRKVYNPLGFSQGYNFILFFIFAGALIGFTLARFQYLNFDVFCNGSAPGECFAYQTGYRKAGLLLHLGAILPAGFLACFQFVPVIRHKLLLAHRLNGYIILLLSLLGTIGALMIARGSFGGGLDIQAAVGLLSILFIGALVMAYVSIKKLRIDLHRAWMMRAWFYVSPVLAFCKQTPLTLSGQQAGSIITVRIIMISAAAIISSIGTYCAARPCDQIASMIGDANQTAELYPDCAAYFSGVNPNQQAVVHADLNSSSSAEAAVAAGVSFGMAMSLALAIHVVRVEIYVSHYFGPRGDYH